MKINGEDVKTNGFFAYDGCHKIYVLEDGCDMDEVKKNGGYEIIQISKIKDVYDNSCDLKFINNWKLDKTYVGQFEQEDNDVKFEF